MALSRKDKVELELDNAISVFWQTVSDIGSSITAGESGVSPVTGKVVRTPGVAEKEKLSLTKVFDPVADKDFVALLLDEKPTAILRSGNTKATLIYYGDDGIDAKYILKGLLLSSFRLPGKDGLSKGYNLLSVEFEVNEITQV